MIIGEGSQGAFADDASMPGPSSRRGKRARPAAKGRDSTRGCKRTATLHSDALGVVLRVRTASAEAILDLMRLKAVSKHWQHEVGLATADEVWLAPWRSKGQVFLAAIPGLVPQMNMRTGQASRGEALVLRRSFVDQVREHLFDAPVVARALQALVAIEGFRYPAHVPPGEVAVLLRRALQAHPARQDVVTSASRLVAAIAEIRDGQDALLDAGAVPELMVALARARPCVSVVQAMTALMCVRSTYHLESHKALKEAGAVPLLIDAMAFNFADSDFQIACMRCIRAMCGHCGLAAALKRMGVADRIFRFMQRNADDRECLSNALGALLCLETVRNQDESVDYFDATRGMQCVISAAVKCAFRQDHVRALRLMDRLQDKSRATTACLLALDVVPFVLYVMQFDPCESVMQTASSVLDRLSSHPLFASQLQSWAVPQKALDMIRRFPDNPILQRHARRMRARFQRRDRLAAA